MVDAEPLFLVDHEQSEIAELDVAGEEAVRPDEDVDLAGLEVPQDLDLFGSALEAGQRGDADGIEGQAGRERLEMLAGQDGGRAQHGDLLAVHDRFEGRAHGHLGLAVADVAAEEPVHGRGGFHVGLDLADRAELVFGLVVFEGLLELFLPAALRAEGEPLDRFAPGVKIQELLGHFLHGFLRPGFGFFPARGSQLVQRRRTRSDGREFLEKIEVLDGDEQAVLVAVAELQKLARLSVDVHSDEAVEEADPVIGVDDKIARLEVLELGDGGLGRGPGGDGLFLGQDVRLAKHDDLFAGIGEAALQIAQGEEDFSAARPLQGRIDGPRRHVVLGQQAHHAMAHGRRGEKDQAPLALVQEPLDVGQKEGDAIVEPRHGLEPEVEISAGFFRRQFAGADGPRPDHRP